MCVIELSLEPHHHITRIGATIPVARFPSLPVTSLHFPSLAARGFLSLPVVCCPSILVASRRLPLRPSGPHCFQLLPIYRTKFVTLRMISSAKSLFHS